MLFYFIKYLQPTHYFQLYKKDGNSVFPVFSELPIEVECNFFTSKKINKMELGNSITLKLMLKNASDALGISKGKVTFEIKNHNAFRA